MPETPAQVRDASVALINHLLQSGAACLSQTGFASDGRACWIFAMLDTPDAIERLVQSMRAALPGENIHADETSEFSAVTPAPPAPAKLSDYDRAHVGQILGDWGHNFTNFGAQVIRLVKKADHEQREVIRRVYPDHVAAVEVWENAPHLERP